MFRVGVDIGSVSVNVVVLDEKGNIAEDRYVRHKGKPVHTAAAILEELQGSRPGGIEFVAVTGTGGKAFASLVGASFTNEIIALT